MERPRVVICIPSMTVDGRITLARGHSSDEEAWQTLIPPSARALYETIQQMVGAEASLHGSGSFVVLPVNRNIQIQTSEVRLFETAARD